VDILTQSPFYGKVATKQKNTGFSQWAAATHLA